MFPNLLKKLSSEDYKKFNMGCAKDFEEVFNAYYAPLCFYSQRFLSIKEAEDEVSGLFVKLWSKKMIFNDVDHLQAFLYSSMKNACIDNLKTSQRSSSRDQLFTDSFGSEDNSLWQNLIRTEVWAEIFREINQLPSQCGKIIKMGYIDDLSNEEIADSLGISIQTVKNHKYRGLKTLKNKLSDLQYLILISFFPF